MSPSRKGRWLCLPLCGMLMACGEDASILVRVEFGDLQIPGQADSLCLGLWDVDSSGGSFGQRYVLRDDLVASLAVDPGSAKAATMLARISRQGIEVNTEPREVDFASDSVVTVGRCASGRNSAATERGVATIEANSSVSVSLGGGGAWIVSVSDGMGQVFQAGAAGLAAVDVTAPSGQGAVVGSLAFDADNDCDDDLLVFDEAGPSLWRRELSGFVAGSGDLPPAAAPARAAVSFDYDGDLRLDLALVGPLGLELWQGSDDGFVIVPDAAAGTDLVGATGIASADLDGDGNLDLVIVRGSDVAASDGVLYGDGAGGFVLEPGAMPDAVTKTLLVGIADIDGDGSDEIISGGGEEPVRAFAKNGPRTYVDRSFLLLPSTALTGGRGLSVSDWNGDCAADLVIANDPTASWASENSVLVVESTLPGATQVLVADLLGTGERDLLLVNAATLRWWKR